MSKTQSKAPDYPGKEVDTKQPPTNASFYDQRLEWRTFLWNSKTNEFLGRNAESWGKITAFYIIFYSFLAAYFAFMMTVLYHTLDDDRPKYTSHGGESILKAPGLGMRPDYRPYDVFRLIEYEPDNENSYVEYVNSINHLLSSYNNSLNDYPECVKRGKGPCGFNSSSLRNSLSTWDENAFGYNSISPLVILKLNKVFDWVPQPYNHDANAIPSELRSYINETVDVSTDPQMVWVWCEAKEEGVTFTYAPHPGFPLYYYPFINQKGYMSPLVAVHVQNLPEDTEVRVHCRPYAKNVKDETLQFAFHVKTKP